MVKTAVILLLVAGFFGVGFTFIVYAYKIVPYRTDITDRESPWTGGHWSWEANALNPKNYSEEGQSKVSRLYGLMVIQALLGFALLFVGFS